MCQRPRNGGGGGGVLDRQCGLCVFFCQLTVGSYGGSYTLVVDDATRGSAEAAAWELQSTPAAMSEAAETNKQAEDNIEIWKIKKLIKSLEAARGCVHSSRAFEQRPLHRGHVTRLPLLPCTAVTGRA